DFSWLPAVNFGTVAAGIVTFSPGVRGVTPWRSARWDVLNLPKPVNATSPPLFSVSVMVSRNASTALPASRRESPALSAIRSTNSCFVTTSSSCSHSCTTRRTLPAHYFRLNHAVLRQFLLLRYEISCAKQRPQPDGVARELVGPAFLTVDDADRGA